MRYRGATNRTCFSGRPMGVFEFAKFEAGTKAVMDAVVAATQAGTTTIIGAACDSEENY